MKLRFAILALALGVLVAMSACGAPPKSGVYGLAVVDKWSRPATPSPLPDDFGSNVFGQYPDPHAVVVIRSEDQHPGQIVARVVTSSDGTFRITLPPGNYSVQGKNLPSFFAVSAPVHRGTYVRLMVPTKEF